MKLLTVASRTYSIPKFANTRSVYYKPRFNVQDVVLKGYRLVMRLGETFFINPDVVSGLGDRDTTCAIVGGIVASHTGLQVIPSEWLESREHLPEWPFKEV